MLSNIVAKHEAIRRRLGVSDVGEIKEKYERDDNTVEEMAFLDIVITNWLKKKQSNGNGPSWRELAHLMYKSLDNSKEVKKVFCKILRKHQKKK